MFESNRLVMAGFTGMLPLIFPLSRINSFYSFISSPFFVPQPDFYFQLHSLFILSPPSKSSPYADTYKYVSNRISILNGHIVITWCISS